MGCSVATVIGFQLALVGFWLAFSVAVAELGSYA